MSPDELFRAGNRLFAVHWQSSLAQLLGVNVRTLRRWVAGQNAIPEPVAAAVRELLAVRRRAEAAKGHAGGER